MMAYEDPALGSSQDGSTTDVAKEQAGRVGQTAKSATADVAQTTKEQAQNVVGEAKQQARDLVGEARTQAKDQAGAQKSRAVQGLRSLGDEIDQMAQQGGQSGMATEVARQVSARTRDLADYIDRHEPADLLEEVRSYARRRPVVFLTGAALAGVLAGRLTRNLASKEDSSKQLSGGSRQGLYGGSPQALPAGEESYGTSYQTGAPDYQTPGYAAPDYQAPGYGDQPPSYQPAGQQSGYGAAGSPVPGFDTPSYEAPGGFREPVTDPQRPAYDPAYEEQPPSRGWTP
jgi:hypothetical protein